MTKTEAKLEMVPVEDLVPYANNSRTHSDEQIAQIAASIQEWGFTNPILIDEKNRIIAGHGRLMGARKLNMDTVPCKRLIGLSEAQLKAYVIADNRIALNAGWNTELLSLEMQELQLLDFDLDLLGFSGDELNELLNPGQGEGKTEPDNVPATPEIPTSKPGDIWIMGKHRLLCGDSTDIDAVDALMMGAEADQLITDPPYNVAYEGKTKAALTIQNDSMANDEFRQFLRDAYSTADSFMKPGAVFYIWHADSEGYNFRGAAFDVGWEVRQNLIWVKQTMVMGRQDYHWKHEPCQPAGTMVLTPDGEVPIEQIKTGDRVVSYNKNSGTIVGLRDGVKVDVAQRHYSGYMYGVQVGAKRTEATDTHRFSVRFNPNVSQQYCTYLMKKGDWWRIGITGTYNARGFGLKHRMRQEDADAAWIIDLHKTKMDAQLQETILSLKFGIPTTHWEPERGFRSRSYKSRDKSYISSIYDGLDLNDLNQNCEKLLHDFGRNEKVPLISRENRGDKFSRRVTAQIASCNLIPELMQLPVPAKKGEFVWSDITEVDRSHFSGTVYSMDVETYEHYIADGIVTHNCLYGWKSGAGHLWASDRKQTTILEFDRPSRNAEHPTMKPVALIEYLMLNNTKGGDMILDLFGWSGTTLIAAEKNGRIARIVELDPKYCDVIVKRWQEYTGKDAVLAETDQTFNSLAEGK